MREWLFTLHFRLAESRAGWGSSRFGPAFRNHLDCHIIIDCLLYDIHNWLFYSGQPLFFKRAATHSGWQLRSLESCFQVIIGVFLRPTQTCWCTCGYLFSPQSAAKVQQNSEKTKLSSKKEPPPNSVPITLRWAAAHDRPDKVSASMRPVPATPVNGLGAPRKDLADAILSYNGNDSQKVGKPRPTQ